MKNNTITVMKKELARFFGDRRLVITTLLLPGCMIYLVYSLLGNIMMKSLLPEEAYVAKAYVVDMPESLQENLRTLRVDWHPADREQLTQIRQEIQDKQVDGLVVFPQDFDEAVTEYQVNSKEPAPNVEIYYNSIETESSNFYSEVTKILDEYENSLVNKLDINAGDSVYYDCATSKDTTGQMFSLMMPMLLMMFLYSGCMSVAPESIAGEKERGTMATLLVTPIRRSSLALGKVFSLSIIALLAGCSSFIGTFAALPKMMGGEMTGVDSSVYVSMDYIMLLIVILSTVLVLVSAISLISAFAKSVKEASTTVSPLMIVITFVSLAPMLTKGNEIPLYRYLIPVYNSAQCMNGIFSFTYQPVEILITAAVNLCVAGILVYGLTRAFHSEKVMFH